MSLKIPVSVGELFDKFSILEIKYSKITDTIKQQIVFKELELLKPFIDFVHLDIKNIVYNMIMQKSFDIGLKKIADAFDERAIKLYTK